MLAGVPSSVAFILLVELCERFCFYDIQGSQKFFLSQRLGYSNAQSTSISNVFNTACYLTCLLGGVLGDRFLGRFLTISFLSGLYVAGAAAVAAATHPSINSKELFFLGAFAGIAVGTGGIKPNVCNFGADQVAAHTDGADHARERFFSSFYWMINVGSGIGLGLMTTLATSPETVGIPGDMGYFYAYSIGTIAMALCLCIFLCGSCTYVNKFLTGRVRIFGFVWSVLLHSARESFRGAVCLAGWLLLLPFFALAFLQAFAEAGSDLALYAAWAAFATSMLQLLCLVWAHCDNSFIVWGGDEPQASLYDPEGAATMTIDDIRKTFQTIPILLVANTVFNFSYSMMIGPFLSESCQMDLRLGSGQLSGAFFNLGDTLAVIAFIPVLESLVYPFVLRRRGTPVTVNEKLLGGFTFAALGMLSATGLEFLRRGSAVLHPPIPGWAEDASPQVRFPGMNFTGTDYADHYASLMGQCVINGIDYCSNCGPMVGYPYCDGAKCPAPLQKAGIYMSSVSAWWMFLPFACIGIGEIMVNPVTYYYAYSLTPHKARSVIQAINLVFQGAYPPALVGVFSTALSSMQPNNLNKGHIEVFYYISLVLIAVGAPIFVLVARACKLERPADGAPPGEIGVLSTTSLPMVDAESFTLTGSRRQLSQDGSRQ